LYHLRKNNFTMAAEARAAAYEALKAADPPPSIEEVTTDMDIIKLTDWSTTIQIWQKASLKWPSDTEQHKFERVASRVKAVIGMKIDNVTTGEAMKTDLRARWKALAGATPESPAPTVSKSSHPLESALMERLRARSDGDSKDGNTALNAALITAAQHVYGPAKLPGDAVVSLQQAFHGTQRTTQKVEPFDKLAAAIMGTQPETATTEQLLKPTNVFLGAVHAVLAKDKLPVWAVTAGYASWLLQACQHAGTPGSSCWRKVKEVLQAGLRTLPHMSRTEAIAELHKSARLRLMTGPVTTAVSGTSSTMILEPGWTPPLTWFFGPDAPSEE
jgi:hypothetical protein